MTPTYTSKPNAVFNNGEPIIVSVSTYSDILAMLDKNAVYSALGRKKISAIKLLRSEWSITRDSKLGLREAKLAIERMCDEIDGNVVKRDRRPKVATPLSIAAVVIDTGNEKVEVDLEELQLRVLSDIGKLGLSECGRILELVDTFQAWNEGKTVGIVYDKR